MHLIGVVTSSAAGPSAVVYLAVIVLEVIAGWKVLEKAGQPGWGIFVPIYNLYLICKIADRPGWTLILLLIPIVNIVICLFVALDIAKAFARSPAFGFGLFFLGFVFIPMLGFGPAQYAARTSMTRV
jgi:hypothetical protein